MSESIFDEPIDDSTNNWKDEWKDMPECNNTFVLPFKQLIVNFKDKADYERFCTLINQQLTEKTKSTWFPEQKETIHDSSTRYVDESEVSDIHNF